MLKRFLTSFVLTLTTVSVFAQTPYDTFAPEQSVKCMKVLEHKEYLLENSDTTATVRYVAIDWNRSSYALIGKDGINISVGMLSELDKKFLSMDQHCEDYYSTSPYMYCLGNPISYVDPNGMDVAVLLVNDNTTSTMDGNPIGHLALLIQNDEGKWLYYSINGVESSWGASDRNDVAIEGNWSSPEEFLNMTERKSVDNDPKSNHNLNIYNYTDAYVIETSKKQDILIGQEFAKAADSYYLAIGNNCATIVQKSILAGGLRLPKASASFNLSPQFGGYGPFYNYTIIKQRPMDALNTIHKENPGYHIKKR